jgi:hypothetical protein
VTGRADIQQFLGLLARNAELIEVCYHDGAVTMTEENAGAIRALRNARVLSTREEGRFGLTRAMREMLDENMQRQQRFAIGGNIGDEINRMEKLLFELEEAASLGKHAEIDTYTSDLCQSLYDIKDLITQDLLQFDQIMSTKFSDVRTTEEKMRQNAHYLERTQRLQQSLEQINRAELHEKFADARTAEAGRVYLVAISRSISGWSASLLANSQVFEQFMFSFRSIEEETRRIRAFTRFLKEGGQSRLVEALDKSETCPALRRVSDEGGELWPDIFSDRGRQAIGAIAAGLKPVESRKPDERRPGQRSKENAPVSIEEDLAREDLALSVFLSFVSERRATWVSAGAWAEASHGVPRAIFLEHVLTWADLERDETEFDVRYSEDALTPRRSANLVIGDIEICQAA